MALEKLQRWRGQVALAACWCLGGGVIGAQPGSAVLPAGVEAVWDADKAYHETTPTRERICLNGLWQWQPAEGQTGPAPAEDWGYFKVPGCWPGITDYMQKDCQTVFAHPSWKDRDLGRITAAWYRREFRVPTNWAGRRIALSVETLNSYAAVYVDGERTGEIHFPGGELDLTRTCQAGATHSLALLVVAMPLKGVLLSYTDSASAREVKGTVERRGLCGDVYSDEHATRAAPGRHPGRDIGAAAGMHVRCGPRGAGAGRGIPIAGEHFAGGPASQDDDERGHSRGATSRRGGWR